MPKFTKMSPKDVLIGRGRIAAERRVPFIAALRAGDAGKIELEAADRSQVVKRVLAEASRETGIKVRSSWEDNGQRVLLWRRTGK